MATPGYKPAPTSGGDPASVKDAASKSWLRQVVELVNNMLKGKLNVTLQVTLTANSATTTVLDARISAFSALLFEPLTSNAAAALYGAPYVLESNKQTGSVVLNHANNAQVDRTFNLVFIG